MGLGLLDAHPINRYGHSAEKVVLRQRIGYGHGALLGAILIIGLGGAAAGVK